MNETPGRSAGPSSRYTVLATNVAKVAKSLQNRDIAPPERVLMERAAELVAKIIEGSLFVERADARGLSNARESLFTVDHAISALKRLTLDPEQAKHLTNIFEQYERDLRTLAAGQKIAAPQLNGIRVFFGVLGDLFYQDVADTALSAPHVESQRQTPSED
jgi:hypothetical protein